MKAAQWLLNGWRRLRLLSIQERYGGEFRYDYLGRVYLKTIFPVARIEIEGIYIKVTNDYHSPADDMEWKYVKTIKEAMKFIDMYSAGVWGK